MVWLVLVGIRIFVADILAKILQKKLAISKSRERALVLQYIFCAVFSWIAFLIFGGDFSHLLQNIKVSNLDIPIFLIIAVIGLANGFGCYCQWRAQVISMSKSATMGIPDDIIALTLIYLVSPKLEIPFLTHGLIVGVILCFIAAVIFAVQKSKSLKNGSSVGYTGAKLVSWVLGYTIIWGTATFLFRFFSGEVRLPWHNFSLIWYNASLISALIIFGITKFIGKIGPKMTIQERGNTFKLVILIWASLVLYYLALKFGTLTATKPIFLVSAMIGPALVGFIVFKEHRGNGISLKPTERLAFILGGIGVLVIALSLPYKLLS